MFLSQSSKVIMILILLLSNTLFCLAVLSNPLTSNITIKFQLKKYNTGLDSKNSDC